MSQLDLIPVDDSFFGLFVRVKSRVLRDFLQLAPTRVRKVSQELHGGSLPHFERRMQKEAVFEGRQYFSQRLFHTHVFSAGSANDEFERSFKTNVQT